LELTLEKAIYQPGEIVRGRARWNLPKFTGSIEARLFFFTEGKGDQDLKVSGLGILNQKSASGEAPFEFQLPEAPVSMHGKFLSVFWAVEVLHIGGSRSVKIPIIVSPIGKEVELDEVQIVDEKNESFGRWRRRR
jgi:hypothetical protein